MSKLAKFKKHEIKNLKDLKGGVFCEWYINERNSQGEPIDNAVMQEAQRLDEIKNTQGFWAAMFQGGFAFFINNR